MPCSPAMQKCQVGCIHRAFVQGYREERQRQLELATEAARGYPAELAEYLDSHPLPTFKQWLIASTDKRRREVAA